MLPSKGHFLCSGPRERPEGVGCFTMTTLTIPIWASPWRLLFLAWLIATASSLGALFIGEVMGQTPCNLCWFQRAFMFPLAVILMIATVSSTGLGSWRYALPVAGIGWAIAVYHNLLNFGVIERAIIPCGAGPSCSGSNMTILGNISIPALSLGAFSLIILLMLLVRKGTPG